MLATLLLTPFFLNDTMCTIHSLCLKGPHSGFKGWGDQDEFAHHAGLVGKDPEL